MKTRFRKSIICLVLAVIIAAGAAAGLFFRSWIQLQMADTAVPLLAFCREDQYYSESFGFVESAGQDQYVVFLEDQFYELIGIELRFGSQSAHSVRFLDSEFHLLKERSPKGGRSRYSVPSEACYLLVSTQSEEKPPELYGVLSREAEVEYGNIPDTAFKEKYVSVLGDSISAYENYIPEGYYYHYPIEDVAVKDMWWYQTAKNLGMNVSMINACAGSGVSVLGDNLTPEMAGINGRGKKLTMGSARPDVVFVMIGGNDLWRGVERRQIERCYRKMLEDIMSAYPEADIYLLNYYVCGVNVLDPEGWLNQGILNLAKEYGLNSIDLRECGITAGNQSETMSDTGGEFDTYGVHPNKRGMDFIAQEATKQLMEISEEQ